MSGFTVSAKQEFGGWSGYSVVLTITLQTTSIYDILS